MDHQLLDSGEKEGFRIGIRPVCTDEGVNVTGIANVIIGGEYDEQVYMW